MQTQILVDKIIYEGKYKNWKQHVLYHSTIIVNV